MGAVLELRLMDESNGVPTQSVADCLRKVTRGHPVQVCVVGRGRTVGKATWIALVLETEYGYRNCSMKLERVHEGSADLAQLSITLEACSLGPGRPLHT